MNAGAFYLRATPPALFFILYFETGSHEVAEGLTKWGGGETGRERERAEAGHEPGSSSLRLPKYWDYKRAPPRRASISLREGLAKLPHVSLKPVILLSQPPKYWHYRYAPLHLAGRGHLDPHSPDRAHRD